MSNVDQELAGVKQIKQQLKKTFLMIFECFIVDDKQFW